MFGLVLVPMITCPSDFRKKKNWGVGNRITVEVALNSNGFTVLVVYLDKIRNISIIRYIL